MNENIKIAVVQSTPVFFETQKTIQKVEEIVVKCKNNNCDLVLFPESYLPGYPRGFTFGSTIGSRSDLGREFWLDYYNQSIEINDENFRKLEQLAVKNKIYLVIGVTEKVNYSLYCSILYFSPKAYMGKHQKVKATGVERLVWADGKAEKPQVFNTALANIGGLICWENYMPEARMALYKNNIEIYLAPTADSRSEWTSTMQHIALEGRCFVLGCNQFFTYNDYSDKYKKVVDKNTHCAGGSIIVSPLGKIIKGPVYEKEEILEAVLSIDDLIKSKLDFDVIGHYTRSDIFDC